MARGDFTKDEARLAIELLDELHGAIPRMRRIELLEQKSHVWMFLRAAERAAPEAGEADSPTDRGDDDAKGSLDGRDDQPSRD